MFEEEKPVVEETVEEVVEEQPKKKRAKKDKNVITGKVNKEGYVKAVGEIENDTMVSYDEINEILVATMEQAYLEWTYPGLFKDKDNDDPAKDLIKAVVRFDDKGFKIWDVKTVMEDDDIVDDAYQISLEDAKEVSKKAKLGDIIEIPFDVKKLDKVFVRRVKQLFQSHLKDASRQAILSVYNNQIGDLIEGTVTKADPEAVSYEISFGKASGVLRKRDIIPGDRFNSGDRVTVYLDSLDEKSNPPSLRISRSCDKFILKLLERNIMEIQNKDVKVVSIAREAGRRTKVFVQAVTPNIDAVGACIGPESSRINAVLSCIKPEKIDILPYYSNKAKQVISAMTPAKIIGLDCPEDFFDANVHYEELENERDYEFPKVAMVVQNGDQGVAIGSKGVNVRLASKLTRTSISVHTADEAIKLGLKYMMLQDVEAAVAAMNPVAPETVENAPVEEAAPIAEETPVAEEAVAPAAEEVKVAEPVEEAAPAAEEVKPVEEATPAVEEAKPVIAPVNEEPKKEEEPVEHVEIKNKPKISLEELEQAISAKKGPSETRSYKKKFNKNATNEKSPSAASQQEAMPIYTDDELAEMDQNAYDENEEDNYNDYDEDLEDYDSDKYYDENK